MVCQLGKAATLGIILLRPPSQLFPPHLQPLLDACGAEAELRVGHRHWPSYQALMVKGLCRKALETQGR